MYVVLFAAQSLDGWITRHALAGDGFTSECDKRHFRAAIQACDACVMGGATYDISKARMSPKAFPGLRRVIWTRRPGERSADALLGVLEFTDELPSLTAARLRDDGRRRCAILGGGQTNAAWLQAGLVDEVCVTVESRIFGFGTPLAAAAGGLDLELELIDAKPLASVGPVLLRYRVIK